MRAAVHTWMWGHERRVRSCWTRRTRTRAQRFKPRGPVGGCAGRRRVGEAVLTPGGHEELSLR